MAPACPYSVREWAGVGDGNRVGGTPGGPQRCLSSRSNDHVDVETDQLGSEAREPLELPLRSPDIEHKVLAFDVPQLLQPLLEGLEDLGPGRVGVRERGRRRPTRKTFPDGCALAANDATRTARRTSVAMSLTR